MVKWNKINIRPESWQRHLTVYAFKRLEKLLMHRKYEKECLVVKHNLNFRWLFCSFSMKPIAPLLAECCWSKCCTLGQAKNYWWPLFSIGVHPNPNVVSLNVITNLCQKTFGWLMTFKFIFEHVCVKYSPNTALQ